MISPSNSGSILDHDCSPSSSGGGGGEDEEEISGWFTVGETVATAVVLANDLDPENLRERHEDFLNDDENDIVS